MPEIPKTIFWMSRALENSLKSGIESWAEDTNKRTDWLQEDKEAWNVIAGSMLVGCFAYAEGKLGKKWWIDLNSYAAKRDLNIHWIIRNAFVHKDSIPKDLDTISSNKILKIKNYCEQLKHGQICDDKGNVYPVHMKFIDDKVIMNKDAIGFIARLFETVYKSFR